MDFVAICFGGPHDGQAVPRVFTVGRTPPTQLDLANPLSAADDPDPGPVYHRERVLGWANMKGEPTTLAAGGVMAVRYTYEPIWLRAHNRTGETK